jgi:hypothetical protein
VLGYEGGVVVFGAGLALVAAGYFFTNVSRTRSSGPLLFSPDRSAPPWAIYSISRLTMAALLSAATVPPLFWRLSFLPILFLPQKAGIHPVQYQKVS